MKLKKIVELGSMLIALSGLALGTSTTVFADDEQSSEESTNTLVINNSNENEESHVYSLDSLNDSKAYWSLHRTHKMGSKYKGAWVTETAQFFFKGRVFFYPARTGIHQGWLKFTRAGRNVGSAKTTYYHHPYSHKKSIKVQATKSIHDSLGWNDPKTRFHYGFR